MTMHETLAAGGDPALPEDAWKREALFRAIADFTYDWESWIDPQGRPRWVNPAVERITGYAPEQCLAMRDYPLRLVDPADRRSMARHLANAAAGGAGNEVEFRIRRKDGGLRWGSIPWQSLLGPDGRCLGYPTSVRDITERRAAEAALPLGEVARVGGPVLPPPGLLPARGAAVPLAVGAASAEEEPPPTLLTPERPDEITHAPWWTARGSRRTRPTVRRCSRRSRLPARRDRHRGYGGATPYPHLPAPRLF